MPTFYNFTQDGLIYRFDDVFVPADLFRQGNLWVWGSNFQGKLGNGIITNTNVSTPVTTSAGGTNWKQCDFNPGTSGSQASSAIKTDGTLWIWGSGSSGQIGNNATTNVSTPVTTFAGGTDWKQVSSGDEYVAAIKTDGTLWIWGRNQFQQLGNALAINISTPITTFAGGTNWKQVSAGAYHTAAIKTDGTLWTWGYGRSGRLGNADTTNKSTPITTFAGGTNWKQVTTGMFAVAAIKTDGTLWTWGSGNNGSLGNAATTGNISTPVTTFAGGTNWKQVDCGDLYMAAIKTDGTLWSWGYGGGGNLGNGAITGNISTPVTTFAGGTNWKQVSAGYHTSSIKTDGTLWTWGYNATAALGINATGNRSTPVTTSVGGTNWKQVSSGIYVTMAIQSVDPT